MYALKINRMNCGGCVATVKKAVQSVDPRAEVTIDLARKHVQVKSEHVLKEITDALAAVGYPAEAAGGPA